MSNSRLTLVFENSSSPELVSTRFLSPAGGSLCVSVRGKIPGAHGNGAGTFQWTSAVQALAVLLLRQAASARSGRAETFLGGSDTLASSLDFALGKAPSWVCEMFGCYSDGTAVAKKLFIRSNPERRRPGPVAIRLNESILKAAEIRIVLDAEAVTEPRAISSLAEQIERRWTPRGGGRTVEHAPPPPNGELPSPFTNEKFFRGVNEAFVEELSTTLAASDFFSAASAGAVVSRMKADLATGGFRVNPKRFFGDEQLALSASERLGTSLALDVLKRKISPDKPLRVAHAIGHSGSSAIFWYLKHFKKIPLELEFEFPYAIEIKHWIETHRFAEPPDLCAMGIAPAAAMVLSRKFREHVPLMLLPAMTHRIVSRRKSGGTLPSGDWCLLDREISTSRMFFDQLVERGPAARRTPRVLDMDPDRIFETLRTQGDAPNAVLFFPHWHLISELEPSKVELGPACGLSEMKEHVLFAHNRVAKDPVLLRAVAVAVRHAWLQLRLSPSLRRQVVYSMLSDASYANALVRISGLANLPAPETV